VHVEPRRRVAEIMSVPALLVEAEATVADACEVLDGEGVGAVFVGRPDDVVGVLSERDVVRLVASGGDPSTTLVRDAMTSPVVVVHADDTLLDAAVQALDLGVRHLPVEDGGRVEGVVSIRDLVRPLLIEALTGHG
jgi:CBS domain-containing protein